jgi:predicted ATP-grasp superfamily ATP-dependent carboligase
MNMGGSTYHISDYVSEIQELALALFRQVGLRGVANAEFKMDERDGKLKLIECNARFTAADCLLVACGLNMPLFVYNRLTGRAYAAPSSYRMGLRLWKPVGDFVAFRQLNKMGLLTFWAWVRSVMHPQIFPVFRWDDPLPTIVSSARLVSYVWSRLLSRTGRRKGAAPYHLPQPSTSFATTSVSADIDAHIEAIIPMPAVSVRAGERDGQ